jgi:hypothetical protein
MKKTVNVKKIVKEVQKLVAEHRVKEALNFIDQHNKPENYRQFRVLCMYNTAALWLEEAGDGSMARQKFFELLQFIETDMSMITEVPSLKEVMEDMYIKTCVIISDLALSYEEYEQHMAKIEKMRPYTPLQKEQMELIQNMKNEGHSWLVNILSLAERHVSNGQDQFGKAAALYQLVLENRRKLRPSRADLKIAAYNYGTTMYNLVQKHLNYCHATKTPCNPDNYLFMLEKTISVLEESKRDVGDLQTTDNCIANLNRMLEKLMAIKWNVESTGYNYTRPSSTKNSVVTEEQMKSKVLKGIRAVLKVLGVILIVIAIFLFYKGLTLPDSNCIKLGLICMFLAIGYFVIIGCINRLNRRR